MLKNAIAIISAALLLLVVHSSQGDLRGQRDLFPFDPQDYLLGHFHADTAASFVRLPPKISGKRTIYLRAEAAEALEKMSQAARTEGIILEVLSGSRSFAAQSSIWNSKFSGRRKSEGVNLATAIPDTLQRIKAILRYSSAPGTSRHHWGTEVDLISTSMKWWSSAVGMSTLSWLHGNAPEFGYQLVYPPHRTEGYRYEPWHWSYAPLARPMLKDYYNKLVRDEDVSGFAGAEIFRQMPWRNRYVMGVSETLK